MLILSRKIRYLIEKFRVDRFLFGQRGSCGFGGGDGGRALLNFGLNLEGITVWKKLQEVGCLLKG